MKICSLRIFKIISAGVLAAILLAAVSCGNSGDGNSNPVNQNTAANTQSANSVRDNVEELSAIITLLFTPEDSTWREDNTAKGKKLTAVLKFSGEDTGKLVSAVEKRKQGEAVEISTEDWYPEELTAQSQLSGNESIKGTAYAADDFFNPPYTHGRLTRVQDTNYFILELTSD